MAIVIEVHVPSVPTLCFSAPTALYEALVAAGYTLQVETPSLLGRNSIKTSYAKLLLSKFKSRCYMKVAWLGYEIGVRVYTSVDTFPYKQP